VRRYTRECQFTGALVNRSIDAAAGILNGPSAPCAIPEAPACLADLRLEKANVIYEHAIAATAPATSAEVDVTLNEAGALPVNATLVSRQDVVSHSRIHTDVHGVTDKVDVIYLDVKILHSHLVS
jgi:hypothetical protein